MYSTLVTPDGRVTVTLYGTAIVILDGRVTYSKVADCAIGDQAKSAIYVGQVPVCLREGTIHDDSIRPHRRRHQEALKRSQEIIVSTLKHSMYMYNTLQVS